MSTAETHMDLDRITHPLRLARGSHLPMWRLRNNRSEVTSQAEFVLAR